MGANRAGQEKGRQRGQAKGGKGLGHRDLLMNGLLEKNGCRVREKISCYVLRDCCYRRSSLALCMP